MTTEQLPDINSPFNACMYRDGCAQRLTLQHHAADQAQRIAELEVERDELALRHRSQHDADSTELRRVCAARDAARKERDELRAQIDAQAAEIERLNQIIINAVHRCCRAAANGPHKMGCDAQRTRQGNGND